MKHLIALCSRGVSGRPNLLMGLASLMSMSCIHLWGGGKLSLSRKTAGINFFTTLTECLFCRSLSCTTLQIELLHCIEEEGVREDESNSGSTTMSPMPESSTSRESTKDGEPCICVDFRAPNKLTKPNTYPLPRRDKCYQNLAGAKYFTCLDLHSGY